MFSHLVRGPGFIEVGTEQTAKLDDDGKDDDGVEDEDEPEDGHFFSPW